MMAAVFMGRLVAIRSALCVLAIGAVACSGSGVVTDPPGTRVQEEPPVANTCAAATSRRVRRLTLGEYSRVVSDLVGAVPAVVAWSAPDVLVNGFDTNSEALTISSGNLDDFALNAELIAEAADVRGVAPCGAGEQSEECAKRFVGDFAARAYGRPLTPEEEQGLWGVYNAGAATSDGYAAGVRLVIQSVLMSPYFLYRTELGSGDGADSKLVELTALEVANVISFALTGSRPDDELRARASGDPAFLQPATLRAEAERLRDTPQARQRIAEFLRSWLGVRDLKAVQKIPAMFPDFTPQLKAELDDEVGRFVDYSLGDGGGTLSALLGGSVSFPSAALFNTIYATDYDAGEATPALPAAGSFSAVPLKAGRRRGVLSLAGWLAAHAPVHRSSPVDRGLAIRSRFFCQSLPPPPPGVVFSAPGPGDQNGTTRQKFEQHAADQSCKGCHDRMDPIGFGFEMMDAVGRYRQSENGLPVDSSGALTGTDVDGPFNGPAELAERLLQSREVRQCFALQLFRYVEGRERGAADLCAVSAPESAFADNDSPIADLLVSLVLRDASFQRSFEP